MGAAFEDWIGRSVTREDIVTPRLLAGYRATLPGVLFEVRDDDVCPPGLHFALAPAMPAIGDTGPDGAERRGAFLPPIPLARRMWAGGTIETHRPIRSGDSIRRVSTIAGITMRQGSAGPLCIVSVRHEISVRDEMAIVERQDLVFRDGAPKTVAMASARPAEGAPAWTIDASPLLLFRFSALTFNGHRIHYDASYAAEEGYPGLVVHGPLQAALMLNMAARCLGRVPRQFHYRCVAPLFAGPAFMVVADHATPAPHVRVIRHDGVTTAEARTDVPEGG